MLQVDVIQVVVLQIDVIPVVAGGDCVPTGPYGRFLRKKNLVIVQDILGLSVQFI